MVPFAQVKKNLFGYEGAKVILERFESFQLDLELDAKVDADGVVSIKWPSKNRLENALRTDLRSGEYLAQFRVGRRLRGALALNLEYENPQLIHVTEGKEEEEGETLRVREGTKNLEIQSDVELSLVSTFGERPGTYGQNRRVLLFDIQGLE